MDIFSVCFVCSAFRGIGGGHKIWTFTQLCQCIQFIFRRFFPFFYDEWEETKKKRNWITSQLPFIWMRFLHFSWGFGFLRQFFVISFDTLVLIVYPNEKWSIWIQLTKVWYYPMETYQDSVDVTFHCFRYSCRFRPIILLSLFRLHCKLHESKYYCANDCFQNNQVKPFECWKSLLLKCKKIISSKIEPINSFYSSKAKWETPCTQIVGSACCLTIFSSYPMS